jgi:2-polyprenyl-6-methoxyphenol hydroxylase-like FAD-dependent oxidoreductase
VVVGAGIGGLTAAIALSKDGHNVTVVERAKELTAAGAGIGLWPNALRAFEEIGVADAMRGVGAPFTSTMIQTCDGRGLSAYDPARVLRHLGGQPIIAHRTDVQTVLLDAAARVPIHTGNGAVEVRRRGDATHTVVTEGGLELEADLVVGADGVNSVVRALVDTSPFAHSPLLTWRVLIADGPTPADAWLSVGRGHQFLATPLPGGRSYLGGLIGRARRESPERTFGTLVHAYGDWHDPIPAFLECMREADVRWDPVNHRRPPRRTVRDHVVLIGDAAHPMTPDLGQGGCQAVEDAVVLAAALRSGGPEALQRYERARRPRVRRIVSTSHRLGQVLSFRTGPAILARNLVMPLVPQRLSLAQVAGIASVRAFERNLAAVAG